MHQLAAASVKANTTNSPRTANRAIGTPRRNAGALDGESRMFDLPAGARTGVTKDKAEHWLYVVAGSGIVQRNGASIALKRGTLVVIQRNERHEIVNNGSETLRAISMTSTFAEAAPSRRWFEGASATVAATAGFASLVISLLVRLIG